MRKRNDNFDLSSEEVVSEFMKSYEHHSHRRHRHHSDGKSTSDAHKKTTEENKSDKNQKKKMPFFFKLLIIIVAVLFFLSVLAGGAVLIMHRRGMSDLNKKKDEASIETIDDVVSYDDSGKTVEYKGQKYVYNENIVTAAFLGIDDKSVSVNITDEYGTAGQADTIMLLIYDTKTGGVSILTVPRDSMVDVDIYSASGNFAGTEEMQICLSFAYGDGGEASCENVIKSIERLLMGIPIDSYFSLRVRGVDALNAAVGGIELTSMESMGQFTKGE